MIRIAFCIGEYPPEEFKRRADAALAFSSDEVEVGLIEVSETPYVHGLTPTDIQMVTPTFIEAYRQAEREGYDAVVPLGTLDIGVEGGKSAVNIPVVGPTEAILHVASAVGDSIGMIVYHEWFIPTMKALVRHYGMEPWIAGWGAVGFDLPDIADNHDAVVERFVAEARRLIDEEGADVIVPLGITQCPVHIEPDWLQKELGVPVVEGIGAPIRFAAMMVSLGLKYSPKRWPKQAGVSPT